MPEKYKAKPKSLLDKALNRRKFDPFAPVNLKSGPRMDENIIQIFLFFCALLSILTTIGILYVLMQESLNFFSRDVWEQSNKPIAIAIDAEQTTFSTESAGRELVIGDRIRINDEEMLITEYMNGEGSLPVLHVIRGTNGTFAEEHPAGATIETGDRVSLIEFFTGTIWQPAIGDFGIFPLVYGTLATSFIAMLVALPLGMGAAIYLSEYAAVNVRSTIKPILEILAGIPTVVYGYFALTFMTPLLQNIFGDAVQIYNSASAGIVVGILIIPMVSSMSEDALNAVPQGLRDASYGLGATKLETTIKVVVPAALSGIMAAFIVAISRAIGETMVVAIAAGAGPQNNIPELLGSRGSGILFEPAETMTGHIARISGGDLSYNSIDYNSIFAIGLFLFALTFVLNIINNAIIRRFREAY